MRRLGVFLKAIAAGIMISVGGAVYLACDNVYIGAVAFCVGLISVVMLGMELYTGKVGFIPTENASFILDTAISVAGNLVGCIAVGFMIPASERAKTVCASKLLKGAPRILADAALCGLLIYVCVRIWKERKNVVGIIFCVPAFILCGFEHSVADMFYFVNGRSFSIRSVLFILLVIVGNALGAVVLHVILTFAEKLMKKKDKEEEQEQEDNNSEKEE